MKVRKAISMSALATLALVYFDTAQANTVTGQLWHVPEVTSQNAIPANVPGTPPDVTFDVNSPISFSAPNATVGAWLASGGAFSIVENTPGTLSSLMDNGSQGTLIVFTGFVTVTNGQTFTVTHDDGLTLIIGGLNLGFNPGPTAPVTTIATYTGPSGNFSFQLVYGECCGGSAVLQVNLPFSNANSTTTTQSNPTGSVSPGTPVTDTATVVGNPPIPNTPPGGTVTFFVCQPPADVTNGCLSGGTQVGAPTALDANGQATSDVFTNTTAPGTYCWRAEYSGDANYSDSNHTDATGECFTVVLPVTEICRTPGFWATHAGTEKANSVNITQAVINVAGSLSICGATITNTTPDSASSAEEALCVPIVRNQNLQLARQLTAAALNCVISGGGADCVGTSIASVFSSCNSLCPGDPSTPAGRAAVTSCISHLGCFNSGFEFANGACTTTPTGCHDQALVNASLGLFFDPPGPAGSPTECNDANKTECTVIPPGNTSCTLP